MIHDTVKFLVSQGREVIYDAEHFFDGCKSDLQYALACLKAAEEAGAVVRVSVRDKRRRAALVRSTSTPRPLSRTWA